MLDAERMKAHLALAVKAQLFFKIIQQWGLGHETVEGTGKSRDVQCVRIISILSLIHLCS